MLTQDFCDHLEYQISKALARSIHKDKRRFWCDGVLLPPSEQNNAVTHKSNIAEIATKAWIDEGKIKGQVLGQFLYDLKLKLGTEAIIKYNNGGNLKDCIPGYENDKWILLDTIKKRVEVELL